MTKTMRIITLLLLTMVGAGQAWAEDVVQFGHITYNGTAANDGGALTFYKSRKVEKDENLITLTNGQSAALTSNDLEAVYDDNDQLVGYKLFIMATPAVGHRLPNTEVGATVSFIQAEVVTSAQQAPSRRNAPDPTIEVGQTLPVKFHDYYTGGGTDLTATEYYGLYYVVMPADANLSVSITATFPEVATNATAIDYVDVDGTPKSKTAGTVYVLDGTEARLGYGSFNYQTEHETWHETWYVCNKDLTYTNGLEFYGKVHLILADGKTMSYDGTERFIYGCGTLDIYGQGGITEGAISAKTTAESCINVYGNLTINGGIVSAESTHETTISCYGIRVDGTLTINRGIVSGKSKYDGISGTTITINGGTVSGTGSDSGIYCTAIPTGVLLITGGHVCGVGDKYGIGARGDINITGGQIEATGGTDEDCAGMHSEHGDIILGWTNPTDYIKASSYVCKNYQTSGQAVKTADGQRLVAFNAATGTAATTIVSGTVADVTTLAGKTLKPLEGNYVSINSVDFTFSGTTSTTSPFTITTGEGETATTTHYYIYKENNTATLSYTGNDFVQVTGLPEGTTLAAVENQPMKRTFTMPATDVELTATAVTGLTATSVAYDGTARTPVIKQGDDVFAPANYTIAYQLGEEAVAAADVKNGGTYTCTLTGLGQYVGTTTVPFVIKRTTSLAVEIVNPVTTVDGHPVIVAGDDALVKVTLVPVKGENETTVLPEINGIVTISVDNGINEPKPYNVAIVNGEGHYYVSNLGQDAYDITASFAGDANHDESTSAVTTLEVCKIPTELDISLDKTEIYVGETATVSITLNQSMKAVVTARRANHGEEFTDDTNLRNGSVALVNGKGTLELSGFDAGIYDIRVEYAGNDEIKGCTSSVLTLTVSKQATSVSVSTNSPVIAKEQVYD